MSTTFAPALGSISDLPLPYYLAPFAGILALVMAKLFHASVMKQSEGDDEMIRIAQAVRDGAMAYLTRQYKVVAGVFVLLLVFLAIMGLLGLQSAWALIGVPVAGILSGLCGWFGMRMATNASARTTYAAKQSLNAGLKVAFRSGAVMGLVVVGFALLDVSFWFFVFNATGLAGDLEVLTTVMLSFGMGASTQALFARVGGGIYTKAADVGADLVGKVEAGIPEDDARNPATIADNVGDNVGDVAGMGADLYESYYGSILATIALGVAAAFSIVGLGDVAIGRSRIARRRAHGRSRARASSARSSASPSSKPTRTPRSPSSSKACTWASTSPRPHRPRRAGLLWLLLRADSNGGSPLVAPGARIVVGPASRACHRLRHRVLHQLRAPPTKAHRRSRPSPAPRRSSSRYRRGHEVHMGVAR